MQRRADIRDRSWRRMLPTLLAIAAFCHMTLGSAQAAEVCASDAMDVRDLFSSLRAHASTKAKGDPVKQHAILREGLAQLDRSLNELRRARSGPAGGARTGEVPGSSAGPKAGPPVPRLCLDRELLVGRVRFEDENKELQAGVRALLDNLERDAALYLATGRTAAKIVGGAHSNVCENLDAVAIVSNRGTCTGLLVDPTSVLTAAHCVCSLGLRELGSGARVILGETVDDRPDGRINRGASDVDVRQTKMIDEGYCTYGQREDLKRGNDLALLFLRTPLRQRRIQLVEGSRRRNCPDSEPTTATIAEISTYLDPQINVVRAVGFGRNDFGNYREKGFVHIAVYSRICGHGVIQARYGCAPGRETILWDPGQRRDTCQGDSGGPVYYLAGNRYRAFAITSRGVSGADCGPGGIYALITPAVVTWMRRNGVNVDVAR
jgi:hypothetical protein